MKGDFSRQTFEADRHYSGVLMQQGRVQLDADWNEQLAIQRHRDDTEAEDVIGSCGGPKRDAGFLIRPAPDGADLLIFPGRFYVHGRLCELEATWVAATFVSDTALTVARWHVDGAAFAAGQYVEVAAPGVAPRVARIQAADEATRGLTLVPDIAAFQSAADLRVRRLLTYLTQPDLPDPAYASTATPPALDAPDGSYLVYLDVWPRHLTALDDDLMREKALGGPDTATRVKTVWQVKLWPPPGAGDPLPGDTSCGTDVASWDALSAPPTGRLGARARPGQEPGPCVLPPGAGYLGLENQLYRVEVHQGGTLGSDTVTFKWSRDNGSVVKAITPIAGTTEHTVDTGPDDVLGLANGQWVEQVDDAVDLNGVARDLFQLQIDPITAAVTLDFPVDAARHPQLRRWDSPGTVTIPWPPVGEGWIPLEDGVEVRFEAGSYRNGDYWLIPARTVLGDVEWPRDAAGAPLAEPRRGIRHAYCRIAVLHVEGDTIEVEDCRPLFPPLTEVKGSYSCCTYTVGDGSTFVGDFTLIQEAVDHLPAEGGQICIFPGTYVENVVVAGGRNVHIKGCGRRTRVVSRPAGAGPAPAVFHLVSTEGVKIESLAVEAAAVGPGIVADGDKPNLRLALEKVSVRAARGHAIRVRGSEDVTIEHCQVESTDFNGGEASIHLQAERATVRENVILGALIGLPPEKVLGLEGALIVSGLQLAGGCEAIRVHDNLFRGCSGQGITLGSLVSSGPTGGGGDDGGGDGGGGDGNPCDDCGDPSTGDGSGDGGGGDQVPPPVSEGLLADIDIRRNRIFECGLDGIGVLRFFSPILRARAAATGSVLVQDLAIVDNRIERCVRRRFASIPLGLLDTVGYGGIALSFVEGLLVRDNRIEDIGHGGFLPVCGLFAVYVEGLEVSRNVILNTVGALNASFFNPIGRRGGIHVVYALPLEVTAPAAALSAARASFPVRRVAAAAVIEENTVDVASGQALSMGALGPVSVVSNRFVSHGLTNVDLLPLIQAVGVLNVLTHFSCLVAIVNLGSASNGPVNMNAASTGLSTATGGGGLPTILSREVLFDDNQCQLDLRQFLPRPGPLPGGMQLPSLFILSLDDVGFADNQSDCLLVQGTMLVSTALLSLVSLRAVSNRLNETLGRAAFSLLSLALMNMTVNNQANHCLQAYGPLRLQAQPNHVLITAYISNFCGGAARSLTAAMRAVS